MQNWMFQSIADRYDLRNPDIVEVGKKDTWYATRYKNRMQEGDTVYFWLGGVGEQRGIYTIGKIISAPYQKPEWDAYGIDVIYEKILDTPLTVNTLKRNTVLSNMLILRAPQATNFLLSGEESLEIELLLGEMNNA